MKGLGLPIQGYEQTTSESCLAACLLMLLDPEPTRDKELSILKAGLEFTKWNFVAGHLDYVAKRYGRPVEWYIEFGNWFNFIKELKLSSQVKVHKADIEERFIREALPAIVYLDAFALHRQIHYPHMIIVYGEFISRRRHYHRIVDPWIGYRDAILTTTLFEGISELRERLKYSPQIIKID